MVQDYSIVSEKLEMRVHVCAFLVIRKTSMGNHLLPLESRNCLHDRTESEWMSVMLTEG